MKVLKNISIDILKTRLIHVIMGLSFSACFPVFGQWQQTGIIPDLQIHALANIGTNLFAGTDCGVLLSTDQGESWTEVNNGMGSYSIGCLAVDGNKLYAGNDNGDLYLSSDNGNNWTAINLGYYTWFIKSIGIKGNYIFIGTGAGDFISANNGYTWAPFGNGLTGANVNSFAFVGSKIFAGNFNGVFMSLNYGNTWQSVKSGIYAMTLLATDSGLYVGTNNSGVFITTNQGANWTAVSNGLPDAHILSMAVKGTHLFSGTSSGVFTSANNGNSWQEIPGLSGINVRGILVNDTNVFAGTMGPGMFILENTNNSWKSVNEGITSNKQLLVSGLLSVDSTIFAATYGGGVFLSSDHGDTWLTANQDLNNLIVYCLAQNGNDIFAGTFGKIYRTTNHGLNWTSLSNGLPDNRVVGIVFRDTLIYAGLYGAGVYVSDDEGSSWVPINTGITNNEISSMAVAGGNILAGALTKIYLLTNNGNSWVNVTSGVSASDILCITAHGTKVFAGSRWGDIMESDDYGYNWITNSSLMVEINEIYFNDSTMYAANRKGFYFSVDDGNTMTLSNWGFPEYNQSPITSISTLGSDIYVGLIAHLLEVKQGVWKQSMLNPLQIDEKQSIEGIDICPNPVTSDAVIKINSSYPNANVSIIDFTGREVFKEKLTGNSLVIKSHQLATGMYFVRLTTKYQQFTKKIIVK